MNVIGIIGMILFMIGASLHVPAGSHMEWLPYVLMGMGITCAVIWHMAGEANY